MDHPDIDRWWRNRRRLAYWSFYCAVAETIVLIAIALYDAASLSAMSAVIGWTYGLWGAVVSAYIGAATWSDVAAKR